MIHNVIYARMIPTYINMVCVCEGLDRTVTKPVPKQKGEGDYSKAERTEPRPHRMARNNCATGKRTTKRRNGH
jgi:hypothetical protein